MKSSKITDFLKVQRKADFSLYKNAQYTRYNWEKSRSPRFEPTTTMFGGICSTAVQQLQNMEPDLIAYIFLKTVWGKNTWTRFRNPHRREIRHFVRFSLVTPLSLLAPAATCRPENKDSLIKNHAQAPNLLPDSNYPKQSYKWQHHDISSRCEGTSTTT